MNPLIRVVAFVAGLAVVFGVMFAVGSAVGPWDDDPVTPTTTSPTAPSPSGGSHDHHG